MVRYYLLEYLYLFQVESLLAGFSFFVISPRPPNILHADRIASTAHVTRFLALFSGTIERYALLADRSMPPIRLFAVPSRFLIRKGHFLGSTELHRVGDQF